MLLPCLLAAAWVEWAVWEEWAAWEERCKRTWINPTPFSAKLHTEDTNLPQLAPPIIYGLSQVFFPAFCSNEKREIFEHDVRCFCKNISSVLCWFNLIAVNADKSIHF